MSTRCIGKKQQKVYSKKEQAQSSKSAHMFVLCSMQQDFDLESIETQMSLRPHPELSKSRHRALPPKLVCMIEVFHAMTPENSYNTAFSEVWTVLQCNGLAKGDRPTASSLAEARARLPHEMMTTLFAQTVDKGTQMSEGLTHWHKMRIVLADGSTVSMPHEQCLIEKFGSGSNQKGECYYPMMRICALALGNTGVLIDHNWGPYRTAEEKLTYPMYERSLMPGDLVMGDGHFGSVPVMYAALKKGAHVLCKAHGSILVEKHIVERYTKNDVVVELPCHNSIRKKYPELEIPQKLKLRAVRIRYRNAEGKKVSEWLLTDLPHGGTGFGVRSLGKQFMGRWGIETMIGDMKTRLGMATLRSKTVNTIMSEYLAHLISYNLVRIQMLHAAHQGKVKPMSLSFTETRKQVTVISAQMAAQPKKFSIFYQRLLRNVLAAPLNIRPGRSEPRALRPRRRPYPYFKGPRGAIPA